MLLLFLIFKKIFIIIFRLKGDGKLNKRSDILNKRVELSKSLEIIYGKKPLFTESVVQGKLLALYDSGTKRESDNVILNIKTNLIRRCRRQYANIIKRWFRSTSKADTKDQQVESVEEDSDSTAMSLSKISSKSKKNKNIYPPIKIDLINNDSNSVVSEFFNKSKSNNSNSNKINSYGIGYTSDNSNFKNNNTPKKYQNLLSQDDIFSDEDDNNEYNNSSNPVSLFRNLIRNWIGTYNYNCITLIFIKILKISILFTKHFLNVLI